MKPNSERLSVFQKMADADPTNELAHFSLGKIHFESRAYPEAVKSLRRTLELSPQHAQAHRLLGEALLELGQKEAGIEVLKKGVVLAHEKGEFQPRNQMQDALRRLGVDPPVPQASAVNQVAGSEAQATGAFVCRRCGKANPQLAEAPFLNDLGKKIHDTICQPCWREWFAMSIKVINEYRLNLLSPQGNEVYETHMKEFLGLES